MINKKYLGLTALTALVGSAAFLLATTDNAIPEQSATALISVTDGLQLVPGAVVSFESHNGEGWFIRH